ncbi:uncharacterized protein FTOL_03620 [Fusarium torulosum]|uniref:Reverse transcriptase domain-containing protein n=1 Tax=Fusarium torulosum TaxID=33205 RepID=A0AAE8SFF9_9HYPO|nr:uncharacterized protein FTOL_03620 [Fusarium torulosum]
MGCVTCMTEEDKQKCLRDSIWTKTSDTPGAYSIRFSALDSNRCQLNIDQSLDEHTVDRLIHKLPSGKAAGRDKIANDAIKMVRPQLLKFLTCFFRACLKLCHIPRLFRHANTVILPKSSKESYDPPKSWRPITLLSAVSKLLEKIAAERLKKAAIESRLLPNTQYGAPGRSTTHAVQDILGVVYKSWSGKQTRKFKRASLRKLNKVTMMGLDISAAFDRVDPDKLLQVLADHAIPDWYLHFTHSFLSDRVTNLQLPRSLSDLFYIYIGIPQGSPLSPLLFLVFAAPLLGEINKNPSIGVKVYAFAYVDDTYLVAVSSSYEKNCRGLEIVHEGIMKWTTSAGVKFSPPKYNLMHFKCQNDTGPDCRLLPNNQGLKDNPNWLRVDVEVLGVVIDHQLTWEAHITDVVAKVEKSLNCLRGVIGTVWGMILWRPGSSSWARFARPSPTPVVLDPTSGESVRVLEKELNIESLRVFLYRNMISSRAKSLEIKRGPHSFVQGVQMPNKWENLKPTGYQLLDQEAQWVCKSAAKGILTKNKGNVEKLLKVWENPARRKAVTNQRARQDACKRSAEIWDQYRRERSVRHAERHRPLAIEGSWGMQSLLLYACMTRAQSTMLLQCRTEFIGLNHFLNRIHAKCPLPGSPDLTSPESFELVPATCSCGHAKQTVFHMFIECPDLKGARRRLEDKLETVDFRRLLTVQGTVAADWAITYFKLSQFEAPRADSHFSEGEGGD